MTHTSLSAVRIMKLEDGDVVALHALLVEPPVATVMANLVHLVHKVWIHNVHGYKVAAINRAGIT